jgi:hypothetical protein
MEVGLVQLMEGEETKSYVQSQQQCNKANKAMNKTKRTMTN